MKFFNVLALVSFFFFLISCDDGVTRFIPVDETGDGSEITGDTENPDSGDTTNPDTGDTENPDTTPDPADSDSPDTTPDPADSDSPDTTPDPADSDSPDTTPDPADSDSPDTTPDPADSDSSDTTPDPADSDSPDTDSPDTDSPDTDSPDTDIPDSDNPDTGNPEDTCYAAVFNGTDSKIEIPANDALNLAYDTWTIEAWIEQNEEDMTSDKLPILRKGATYNQNGVYVLNSFTKAQFGSYTYFTLNGYVSYSYKQLTTTKTDEIQLTANNVKHVDGWNHIAMVKQKEGNWNPKYNLLIFVNGKQVESKEFEGTPTLTTNNDALVIGANLGTNKYFKGSIDSIRISNTAKYSNTFTPAPLKAENDTVAFWDFTNNANDATAKALNGTVTNVTYTNDCKK